MPIPRDPVSALPVFVSAVVLALTSGCAKKSFAVEVTHGFTGYVHIFCGPAVGFPTEPVRVNPLGGADATSCPGSNANVTVVRDGKPLTPRAVSWERSDDGTPLSLSFTVN